MMNSQELSLGDSIPNFSLPSYDNEEVSINDFAGKNIVIYFYPKDDTPGCTIEAKNFSCKIEDFEELNTVILGISRDLVKSHEKFKQKYDLKHILLADPEGKICQKFGCWVEKSMFGKKYMGVARKTFLFDNKGILRKICPDVKITGHIEDVIKQIKSL